MRTLQFKSPELGAVPTAAIITGASNIVSSLFASSAAKKTAASQASIAQSQASIADAQTRLAESNQSFELTKLENERRARTQTILIIVGGAVVVTGIGVAVYFSSQNKKQKP
ncbi:MAG: hypothetical protein KIT62_07710 [Cyclobacteriaceae bacterium]|nr:hypothetical protein [Cyclobacteriaceae bacterium]